MQICVSVILVEIMKAGIEYGIRRGLPGRTPHMKQYRYILYWSFPMTLDGTVDPQAPESTAKMKMRL